jgi:hypothetical protein
MVVLVSSAYVIRHCNDTNMHLDIELYSDVKRFLKGNYAGTDPAG